MINEKLKNQFKEKFLDLSNWEEIEELVLFYQKNAKELDFPSCPETIEKKHISYLLFSKKKKYKQYQVPKKNKKEVRLLEAPTTKLKAVQVILLQAITLCYTARNAAHGFVKERSIVTNAKKHVGRKFIYNIDLENFFPSIHFGRVRGVFKSKPFCFSSEMATIIANLCCNDDNVLPQGAPTSPIISNLVCRALDTKLSRLAKNHRIKYTRYADDITFSSNRNIFGGDFVRDLQMIVKGESFAIHPQKTRLLDKSQRQVVTGLVVNQKLNVKKEYIRELKWLIKLKERDKNQEGIAIQWLEKHYSNRHRYNGKIPTLDNIIEGKLQFLKMVVGEERALYQNILRLEKKVSSELDKNEREEIEREYEKYFKEYERAEEKVLLLISLLKLYKEYGEENYFKRQNDKVRETLQQYKDKSNDKGLVSILLKKKINNSINSIFSELLQEIRPIEERSYGEPHNPQHFSIFMNLFRDSSHPLGILLHGHESKSYRDVVNDAFNDYGKLMSNKPRGLYQRIPREMYRYTKSFIGRLKADVRIKKYGDQLYSHGFEQEKKLIKDFKACYRFNKHDNIRISNLLLSQLKEVFGQSQKIWYFKMDQEVIDNDFEDVLTSIPNIAYAIKLILRTCDEYSKIGAIEIVSQRKINAVHLKIINLGYDLLDKDSKDFKVGGNISKIKSLLTGYCDLRIACKFKDGNGKKILLPNGQNDILVEHEEPEGFTYELKFYRPLKVLLIDDGENKKRIQKAEKIIIENPRFKKLIDFQFNASIEVLNSYNAVFIHANNNGFESLRLILEKNQIPHVIFGGGKSFNIDKNFEIVTLNDEAFYQLLKPFLESIEEKVNISFDIFKTQEENPNYHIKRDGASKISNIDESMIYDLADDFQKDNISLEKIPIEYLNRIKTFINQEVEIPRFYSLRQLISFLKEQMNE